MPFVDADAEIEKAAGMSIADIFARHGEAEFRSGEARVIARLLDGGPQVLATGGGAFMNPETRAAIKAKGVSIWLTAELDVLMRRIGKRKNERPMLQTADPGRNPAPLLAQREPVYAQADITVQSRDVPHDAIVADIVDSAGRAHLQVAARRERKGAAHDRSRCAAPMRRTRPSRSRSATRSYDIVIGRGLVASLGARIAALRPGAKAVIVTDENVARHISPAAEGDARRAGVKPRPASSFRPARARKAFASSSRCARRSSPRASSAAISSSRSAAA